MSKIKPIDCDKQTFINSLINPSRLHERAIKQRYPKHYEEIIKFPGEKFQEKLYNYVHNIKTQPVCKMCGKPVTFETYNKGYHTYCCNACATSDPDRLTKMKETLIKRYGVDNANKSKEIKARAKQTCIDRYGCENPSGSELIKEKKKQKAIARYGVDNVSQAPEVIEKIKQANLAKYGEANIQQAKAKQNNPDIIRFEGRKWICQCPHPDCNKCEEKWYETGSILYRDRKKDGTELCTRLLPLQPNISTYELRIRSWLDEWDIKYKTNVHDIIDGELDIYIPSKKIAIEFNGTYHHRTVDKIETTGKPKEYHLDKFKKCLAKDIQLISIWQDEILYKESACKNLLFSHINKSQTECKIRSITGIIAQRYILNNFPSKYEAAKIYKGVFRDGKLIGCIIGMDDIGTPLFKVYCFDSICATTIFSWIVNEYDTALIKTNNDHVSYRMMIDAGFKHKETILEEKIRTVNNHGTFPTHNSGTSIWTIR